MLLLMLVMIKSKDIGFCVTLGLLLGEKMATSELLWDKTFAILNILPGFHLLEKNVSMFFSNCTNIDKQPFVKYIYFILFGHVTQCLQTKVSSSIQVMRLKEVKKENNKSRIMLRCVRKGYLDVY